MQLPFASLLANLELIRATHPELRSSCIFLQTWLELAMRGRAPEGMLPSHLWLENILRLSPLATIKLFEAIPVEERRSSGFALFDEGFSFRLSDGRESVPLAHVAGFHACLAMTTTVVAGKEKFHYLIDGAYWSGQPLPRGIDDPRQVILVNVKVPGEAPYVLPMIRHQIQILKEADGAAA
ncbi:MAG TPA: hypothetical protein VFO10_10905 [Oligoflexus sp.]|uniref:hypothetical protein n=1 Tax=Oligoflexus sp. TaxID=1971216 RepID=UPI002D7FD91A|nr:hypothetical protein [Oligoflexus sp.]HET9237753.1 hypothetical protein [Oligoflexus sp.]